MNLSLPTRRQKLAIGTSSARVPELLSPRTFFVVALCLGAVVFTVYNRALEFQFVLDDHRFTGDPRIQSPGYVWDYFAKYVWSQFTGGPPSFYRPLFILWLRINFILSAVSPWGWHLLSITKHVAVTVLLGLLALRLLRDRVAALFAATLFALHPAQTESVAWVTVPDPLMSAALLVSLFLYLEYGERRSARARLSAGKIRRKSRKQIHEGPKSDLSVAWLVASAGAFLTALMAKETAIVWPAVLFAVALITPFGRGDKGRAAMERGEDSRIRLISAFREALLFLCVAAIYLLCRFYALGGRLSPATQHLVWSTVLLSWPATLWFYVKVLLWPLRPRAFADPSLTATFSLRAVLLPGLGVCCAVAILVWACVWAWRRARRDLSEREATRVARALLLGTLILVLPIVLTLNLNALNPGDFLHGRYTYLSLTGLMLLLATGWHLAKKWRTVLLSAAGLVAVAFSVLTMKQESAWKDDLTVFTVDQ